MIEAVFLKLCFDEGELQQYLDEHNKIATVIHANFEPETDELGRQCYFVSVEKW